MYYSNSNTAKPTVDNWYLNNIVDKGYDSYVSTGVFCEQAKVKSSVGYSSGNAVMEIYDSYMPNFKCSNDGNGNGELRLKVGLLTYDELIYAGAYYQKVNTDYYLFNKNYSMWTMSPAANEKISTYTNARIWYVMDGYLGRMISHFVIGSAGLKPVINLNANVLATGIGTSTDPYVVQTN